MKRVAWLGLLGPVVMVVMACESPPIEARPAAKRGAVPGPVAAQRPELGQPPHRPDARKPGLTIIDLDPQTGDLQTLLTVEAGKALKAKRRPFVEMRASWCGVCRRVDPQLHDPALAGVTDDVALIRVDTDAWQDELRAAGLVSKTIPAFYAIDARGRPTGHWVGGHRWSDPAAITAKLEAFFTPPG